MPLRSRSAATVDGRADVYSLACVLYECLTGNPPFERARATEMLFAHLNDEPPSLHSRRPSLPDAVDPVVGRGLAKNPDERNPTCSELCDATRAVLGLERGLSRRRLLLVAGGAALAAAAAAAIPAIVLSREGRTPKRLFPLDADSVVRIDPMTNGAIAAIPSGSSAGPIAFGSRSVWLADSADRALRRIDPLTNTVVAEIPTHHPGTPDTLTTGGGRLWISSNSTFGPYLFKYEGTTGTFTAIEIPVGSANSYEMVRATGGSGFSPVTYYASIPRATRSRPPPARLTAAARPCWRPEPGASGWVHLLASRTRHRSGESTGRQEGSRTSSTSSRRSQPSPQMPAHSGSSLSRTTWSDTSIRSRSRSRRLFVSGAYRPRSRPGTAASGWPARATAR